MHMWICYVFDDTHQPVYIISQNSSPYDISSLPFTTHSWYKNHLATLVQESSWPLVPHTCRCFTFNLNPSFLWNAYIHTLLPQHLTQYVINIYTTLTQILHYEATQWWFSHSIFTNMCILLGRVLLSVPSDLIRLLLALVSNTSF